MSKIATLVPLDGGDAKLSMTTDRGVYVGEMKPDFTHNRYTWEVRGPDDMVVTYGEMPFGDIGSDEDDRLAGRCFSAMKKALLACAE